MGKIFKRLLDVLGLPGDLETISRWVSTLLGISAVSAGLVGYAQGLGWAIFIFMGTFAFGMAAFSRLQEMRDDNQMQYKLIPRNLSLNPVGTDQNNQLIVDMRTDLENHAKFPIWYDIDKFEFEINGRPIINNIDAKPQVIPSQSSASGWTPRLPTGDASEPRKGHMRITHRYGRSKGTMNMRLLVDYEFELEPGFVEGKPVATSFGYRIANLRYELQSEELE